MNDVQDSKIALVFSAKTVRVEGFDRFVLAEQIEVLEERVTFGEKFRGRNLLERVERNVLQTTLRLEMFKELPSDGRNFSSVFLGHMWCLIKNQWEGQRGNLLVNGLPNIGKIVDDGGRPIFVCALRLDNKWGMGAYESFPRELCSGGYMRVFE